MGGFGAGSVERDVHPELLVGGSDGEAHRGHDGCAEEARAYAEDAMQQLVERNIIQSYEVTASRTAPGKLRADVGWRDLTGKQTVSV